MKDNKLGFLINSFPEYLIHFSNDNSYATIINPFYDENIIVDYYEDDFSPFCARFSFQHRHFVNKDDLVNWINEIVSGNILAIEFFKNEQNRFGGDIKSTELEELSYAKLEQYSGYYGSTKLYEISDSFKVRGWKREDNFDGIFHLETNGTFTIEKLMV